MRLIVELSTDTDEEFTLGQRILIAGHVTRLEQDRLDVSGFNAGRKYEESLDGNTDAYFSHDAILTGNWEVRAC